MDENIKTLTIDLSGIDGLAPQHEGGLDSSSPQAHLRILGTDQQYAIGDVNPVKKVGYLSPSNDTLTAGTATGGAITTILSVSQIDPTNSDIYWMDEGSGIWKQDSFSTTAIALSTAITGTSIVGTDMEIYQVNGVKKLFYSYKTSTAGDIGIYDLSSDFQHTWLSSTATAGTILGKNIHKIQSSDNGFAYVLDGSAVHKLDGTTTTGGSNGTFTPNVLLFPATINLIDSIDHNGYIWIALQRTTIDPYASSLSGSLSNAPVYAGVYVWDRESGVTSTTDFIPITGIKAIRKIFTLDGVPHCITLSTSNRTQIREFDGNTFKVVEETFYEELPSYRDSVAELLQGVVWLGNNGRFMYYGKVLPGAESRRLFSIGNVDNIANYTSSGAIAVTGRNVSDQNTESIFVGYRGGAVTEPKFGVWYPFENTDLDSSNIKCGQGNFKTLSIPLPKLSEVLGVTLFYPPTSSSGSTDVLDVDLYLNQSQTSWGTTTLTLNDGARGFKFFRVGQPNVNFLQLGLKWSTAVALSDTITPSYARVEYKTMDKEA